MKEEEKAIGTSTIEYDESGNPTSATFVPEMRVTLDDALREQLMRVDGSSGSDRIKEQSELVMGTWFSAINEIELADREQYEVATEVIDCVKHEGGGVRKCVMRFSLRKRG